MKRALLIPLFTLLAYAINVNAAELLEAKASSLCFGHQKYGSSGEYEKCVETANTINSLSTKSLNLNSRCVDVRDDLQERINSGCLTAAFIVQTGVQANIRKIEQDNRTVIGSCERSGWSNGSEWKDGCLNGSHRLAIEAETCAISAALAQCEEKGYTKCSQGKVFLTYQYYFWGEPRCAVKAKIVK